MVAARLDGTFRYRTGYSGCAARGHQLRIYGVLVGRIYSACRNGLALIDCSAARAMLNLTGTRLTVDGKPLGVRGAVLVANHCSYLDSLVLIAAFVGKTDFVAKAEFAPELFAGNFLGRIGTLFVERFEVDRGVDDTQAVMDAAHSGWRLLIYPEGSLTRRPGLLAFKFGAFSVSPAAKVPVVSITICGTRSILRCGQWFPRLGDVAVTVGAKNFPTGEGFKTATKLRDDARLEIFPDAVNQTSLVVDRRKKATATRN